MAIGRRARAIRPIKREVSIPEDVYARAELLLYEPASGRVPFGAWSNYITGLIVEDLQRRQLEEKE